MDSPIYKKGRILRSFGVYLRQYFRYLSNENTRCTRVVGSLRHSNSLSSFIVLLFPLSHEKG